MNRSALAAFIDELRARLARGDFADHPPIRLSEWITIDPTEQAIRRMLDQVELFRAMTPDERQAPHIRGRREMLARQLEWLHDRLSGIPLGPPKPRQF